MIALFQSNSVFVESNVKKPGSPVTVYWIEYEIHAGLQVKSANGIELKVSPTV